MNIDEVLNINRLKMLLLSGMNFFSFKKIKFLIFILFNLFFLEKLLYIIL